MTDAQVDIPFVMTNAMKAALRERGLTDDAIAEMTPGEAHKLLGNGADHATDPLEPDRNQLEIFVDAMFRHAGTQGFVSIRSFYEDDGASKPFRISPTSLKGGLRFLMDVAEDDARRAAQEPKRVVFCPPVAIFANKTSAKETDVLAGLALSVECDQRPKEARATLERLLGPVTVAARSGGVWIDPEGAPHDKEHTHWRLSAPAQGAALPKLKALRTLAAQIVGGDPSNKPIVHPIRWPGSWHRKGEPRLCEIVVVNADAEIDLDAAFDILSAEAAKLGVGRSTAGGGEGPAGPGGDKLDWAYTFETILSGVSYHPHLVPLASSFAGKGAPEPVAREALRALLLNSNPQDPERQRRRAVELEKLRETVRSGYDKFGTTTATGGSPLATAALFDPWERYIVPEFPFEILPPVLQNYVGSQAEVIGVDPSAMAMSSLTAISGALDHQFSVKMMRGGDWREHPRFWLLMCGDPSVKKTPCANAATRPLELHEADVRRDYQARLREYERAKQANQKDTQEPAPPVRYVVFDTTVEKLGDIIARSDKGLLVKRDEFSGWIGDLERYGGGRQGASGRGFWLKAYDGGPYGVDRVGRGETYIGNLSVSLLGGIQPERLSELHGLTSDGLLQRFVPVMMRAATLARDIDNAHEIQNYDKLIAMLIRAPHRRMNLTNAALAAMDELRADLFKLEQVAGALATSFQGFVGKLPGLAGRLAVILRMAADPEYPFYEIDADVVIKVRAVILDFIVPHAREFYRTAEEETDGERLRRIASWLLTSKRTLINSRDFARNVWCLRGLQLLDLQKQVSPLVAAGWLEPVSPFPSNTAWKVAPGVAAQFEQRRLVEEEQKARIAKLMGSPRRSAR
jgi:Protein of unknown function (DUF3987)